MVTDDSKRAFTAHVGRWRNREKRPEDVQIFWTKTALEHPDLFGPTMFVWEGPAAERAKLHDLPHAMQQRAQEILARATRKLFAWFKSREEKSEESCAQTQERPEDSIVELTIE